MFQVNHIQQGYLNGEAYFKELLNKGTDRIKGLPGTCKERGSG